MDLVRNLFFSSACSVSSAKTKSTAFNLVPEVIDVSRKREGWVEPDSKISVSGDKVSKQYRRLKTPAKVLSLSVIDAPSINQAVLYIDGNINFTSYFFMWFTSDIYVLYVVFCLFATLVPFQIALKGWINWLIDGLMDSNFNINWYWYMQALFPQK